MTSETPPIWPQQAPGSLGDGPSDRPTLTLYPAQDAAPGAPCVLILPGGGYSGLAAHEGGNYAEWFNARGIHAGVLAYRLGSAGYRHPCMEQDAVRGLQLLRSLARSRGWDPARVAVIGSSAGGHLAALLLTTQAVANPTSSDPVEHESPRPDLGILCYPVILTSGPDAHIGSRNNLLGADPPEELVRSLSAEQRVSSETPPCFIWHTFEDTGVPPTNSLAFSLALCKNRIPHELHLYEKGRHGLGLDRPGNPAPPWDEALCLWLKLRRWL